MTTESGIPAQIDRRTEHPVVAIVTKIREMGTRTSIPTVVERFADNFLIAVGTARREPDTSVDLPIPGGDLVASTVVRFLVGKGDKAVYSLKEEIPKGANLQLFHPISGVSNLFVGITVSPHPDPTEMDGHWHANIVDRRVVSSHNLPLTAARTFLARRQ